MYVYCYQQLLTYLKQSRQRTSRGSFFTYQGYRIGRIWGQKAENVFAHSMYSLLNNALLFLCSGIFFSSCHLLLSSVARHRLHNEIDECGIEHSNPVMYCMYCMYVYQCISNMQHPNNALCNTSANTPHSPSESLELSTSHSQSQCQIIRLMDTLTRTGRLNHW